MAIESSRNGNPWISVARLTEIFYKKYGVSLEVVAKVQGYSYGLRSLLTSSGRFSIYGTPIPQEFYVALLQAVVPSFHKYQATSIKDRMKRKRPEKVDESLPTIVKAEGAEDISPRQIQRISEYQRILSLDIKSVNDLETALIEIIKILMVNQPENFVTIAVLSKKFHDDYKQPIRTVIRSVCPDMKLIEILQTIPSLHVQKLDNDWQITVEAHSVIE
ncbi:MULTISPECIES: hypothetical protein [unclassified Microcoleus]|uniref:hypothetical protein n=1 Tax=unclassified Microcoleus TaxID=2642155 RepID=UPI002FD012E4